MEELEVVNMLLRAIGSSPVNSVSRNGGAHPDIAAALTVMDRARRNQQKRGWWFNTDYNVTFSPDTTDVINVANHVVSVETGTPELVVRGKKLYNTYKNTYTFTEPVTADRVVVNLDWDDMPDIFQEYCAYVAMAQFIRDELEDSGKEQSVLQDAARVLIDVKNMQLRMRNDNAFNRTNARLMRAGVRPTRGSSITLGVQIP